MGTKGFFQPEYRRNAGVLCALQNIQQQEKLEVTQLGSGKQETILVFPSLKEISSRSKIEQEDDTTKHSANIIERTRSPSFEEAVRIGVPHN